jgi:hypothetical protein
MTKRHSCYVFIGFRVVFYTITQHAFEQTDMAKPSRTCVIRKFALDPRSERFLASSALRDVILLANIYLDVKDFPGPEFYLK